MTCNITKDKSTIYTNCSKIAFIRRNVFDSLPVPRPSSGNCVCRKNIHLLKCAGYLIVLPTVPLTRQVCTTTKTLAFLYRFATKF